MLVHVVGQGSEVIDRLPPGIVSDGGGGGGWAWLVTTQGVIEAELVKGLLEAAGIVPVALDTRDPSAGAWLFPFGDTNALVRVYVPRSLLEAARLALLETGYTLPEVPGPRVAPARGPWFWVTALVLVAAVVGVTVLRILSS